MSRKDATKKSWYEHVIFKILGMIVILIAIDQYIDYKIANKFDDSQIARRIASQIRPSLIFDHNRTIRWDSGGGQFIRDISVEMTKGEPSKVIISPTEHLNTPPILECLNYNFDITPKRTGKSDWLFELSSPSYMVFEGSPERKEWLFRLEIVR